MNVYHMDDINNARIERGTPPTIQAIRRSAGEAARLKAAHRYFQRIATRRLFRREEVEEAT